MREFTESASLELKDIMTDFPDKRSALMMVLRLAEKHFGSIDNDAMELVARTCEVSEAHVLGMVTFYTHFKRPWHGKHRFMVCATLMCTLGGTSDVLEVMKRKLNIEAGQITPDLLFSLEKVECLADCDHPPVIQLNERHLNSMSPSHLESLLDSLMQQEGVTQEYYRLHPGKVMEMQIPFVPVKEELLQHE